MSIPLARTRVPIQMPSVSSAPGIQPDTHVVFDSTQAGFTFARKYIPFHCLVTCPGARILLTLYAIR